MAATQLVTVEVRHLGPGRHFRTAAWRRWTSCDLLEHPSVSTHDWLHQVPTETAVGGLRSGGSLEDSSFNREPGTTQLEKESQQRPETEAVLPRPSSMDCKWELSPGLKGRQLQAEAHLSSCCETHLAAGTPVTTHEARVACTRRKLEAGNQTRLQRKGRFQQAQRDIVEAHTPVEKIFVGAGTCRVALRRRIVQMRQDIS